MQLLFMLGLKLIHVTRRATGVQDMMVWYFCASLWLQNFDFDFDPYDISRYVQYVLLSNNNWNNIQNGPQGWF